MLTLKDKNRVPFGGCFPYVDPETKHVFCEPYFNNTLNSVKKHRLANNLPVGIQFEEQTEDLICQELIRRGVPNVCTDDSPVPSLLQQADNFTRAMFAWAKAGFAKVSEEEYERRMRFCTVCPNWNPDGYGGTGRCMKCGCGSNKLLLSGQKCPIGLW